MKNEDKKIAFETFCRLAKMNIEKWESFKEEAKTKESIQRTQKMIDGFTEYVNKKYEEMKDVEGVREEYKKFLSQI